MGIPPQPSALHSLLTTTDLPPQFPHLHHLALQVAHNLRFQHGWMDVRIHSPPTAPAAGMEKGNGKPLPRPILSGRPPKRLYVHPDEQVEVLQRLKNERSKHSSSGNGDGGVGEKREKGGGEGLGMRELDSALQAEREWVLPSHLREKWSLRRFGEVFDAVAAVPGAGEGEVVFVERGDGGDEREEEGGVVEGVEGVSEWRTKMPKRLLLATLDDDSTVVYYIVHDGIVKPRQN